MTAAAELDCGDDHELPPAPEAVRWDFDGVDFDDGSRLDRLPNPARGLIHAGGLARRANGTQLVFTSEDVRFMSQRRCTPLKPARPIPSRPISRSACPKARAAFGSRRFSTRRNWTGAPRECRATGRDWTPHPADAATWNSRDMPDRSAFEPHRGPPARSVQPPRKSAAQPASFMGSWEAKSKPQIMISAIRANAARRYRHFAILTLHSPSPGTRVARPPENLRDSTAVQAVFPAADLVYCLINS